MILETLATLSTIFRDEKDLLLKKPSSNWVVVGAADDMYMYPQTIEGMSGDHRNKISSVLYPLKLCWKLPCSAMSRVIRWDLIWLRWPDRVPDDK